LQRDAGNSVAFAGNVARAGNDGYPLGVHGKEAQQGENGSAVGMAL